MIGKWFLPLPFIFANKNYTLTEAKQDYFQIVQLYIRIYYYTWLITIHIPINKMPQFYLPFNFPFAILFTIKILSNICF